jgi:hypothetical protein
MGGTLKLLSLATALLSPVVRSLDVVEARVVPGAYIVELAENKVSSVLSLACLVQSANRYSSGTCYTIQQAR